MNKKEVITQVSFYNYIHCKLWTWTNNRGEISTNDARKYIHRGYRIPKPIISAMLKEMEVLRLLHWANRDLIILEGKPHDVLEDTSKLYHSVGLW